MKTYLDHTSDELTPMTPEETEVLLTLLSMEASKVKDVTDLSPKMQEQVKKLASFQIFDAHLRAMLPEAKITFPARMFASIRCDRPGVATLWAATFAEMYRRFEGGFRSGLRSPELPDGYMTLCECTEFFAMGLPSMSCMQRIHESNKREAYNRKVSG